MVKQDIWDTIRKHGAFKKNNDNINADDATPKGSSC